MIHIRGVEDVYGTGGDLKGKNADSGSLSYLW